MSRRIDSASVGVHLVPGTKLEHDGQPDNVLTDTRN